MACACILLIYAVPQQTLRLFIAPAYQSQSQPSTLRKGYLVDNPYCEMTDMDPWDPSVRPYVKKTDRGPHSLSCQKIIVTVSSKEKLFRIAESNEASCCYREIYRVTQDSQKYKGDADNVIRKSDCKTIKESALNGTIATTEFFEIECKNRNSGKITKDYQAIVIPPAQKSNLTMAKAKFWKKFQDNERSHVNSTYLTIDRIQGEKIETLSGEREKTNKPVIKNRENGSKTGELPPSVLIIGIDSVSRLHMMRSFPKAKKLLSENGFTEMHGYTKIGENTFPNLMGVLLGQEPYKYSCWSKRYNKIDDCPFIWKNFSRSRYVTALLEDAPKIAIFNYLKTGFVQQPTDYYFRPMGVGYNHNLGRNNQCVGGGGETEFMLKYIKEFIQEMREKIPYFLLSWFTSLSHGSLNNLQTVDTSFRDLLSEAVKIGRDNTVIIFMSDHGFRFGAFRESFLGYYEEALPFFFIRMPTALKKSHPDWYSNLQVNSHRLTSPLDLHATLEDILSLSHSANSPFSQDMASRNKNLNNTRISAPELHQKSYVNANSSETSDDFKFTHFNRQPSFRKTYSFFEEAPINRTCESSGIPQIYCRCGAHAEHAKTSNSSHRLGEVVIQKVNLILENEIKLNNCVSLQFSKFIYLRELSEGQEWNNFGKFTPYREYLVAVEAKPSGAHFESKVREYQTHTKIKSVVVVGDISRINKYEGQNNCVSDHKLKPYCVCPDFVAKKKS